MDGYSCTSTPACHSNTITNLLRRCYFQILTHGQVCLELLNARYEAVVQGDCAEPKRLSQHHCYFATHRMAAGFRRADSIIVFKPECRHKHASRTHRWTCCKLSMIYRHIDSDKSSCFSATQAGLPAATSNKSTHDTRSSVGLSLLCAQAIASS